MKTQEQMDEARAILAQRRKEPRLTTMQQLMLMGMQLGVVWCADGDATTTLDAVLAGKPLATGEAAKAAERFVVGQVENQA